VRQGDPFSLIVYLLFSEPLLLIVRKMIPGVALCDMKVEYEPYVNDQNILITKEEDLLVIDDIFIKFEGMSGALLNRSHKSKIMGLGSWTGKDTWTLPWLKVKQQIKVFGFVLYKVLIIPEMGDGLA
jgi:hypothetical protein